MIELVGVSKTYSRVEAVADFDLVVARGGRVALLGPSGCGKTTLLRLVAGLEWPDAGEVRIGGETAATARGGTPPFARGVGFVFQDAALFPHMTVAANLGYGLDERRAARSARVAEMLEAAGLGGLGGRYPSELSGGQQRRVALARALAPAPARLLMDEPLTSLDTAARDELLALTDRLVTRSGASLLYVTHDSCEADALRCDVVRMEGGRRVG